MKKDHPFIDAKRRGFLQSSLVATGAAAAVASSATQAETLELTAPETATARTEKAGYRETEQVRRYYRMARF